MTPAKLSDQPEVKGVLERDSTLLLSIIYRLNNGVDYNNSKLNPPPKQIFPFAALKFICKEYENYKKEDIKQS